MFSGTPRGETPRKEVREAHGGRLRSQVKMDRKKSTNGFVLYDMKDSMTVTMMNMK